MLPTHQQVARHAGYTIYQRQPGFEFAPTTLRKFASYLVTGADRRVAVFAFSYSPLDALAGEPLAEDGLLAQALSLIERCIDQQKLENRHEYTFEYQYQDQVFNEVVSPRWWLPVST